jgi:hypothetical protein
VGRLNRGVGGGREGERKWKKYYWPIQDKTVKHSVSCQHSTLENNYPRLPDPQTIREEGTGGGGKGGKMNEQAKGK